MIPGIRHSSFGGLIRKSFFPQPPHHQHRIHPLHVTGTSIPLDVIQMTLSSVTDVKLEGTCWFMMYPTSADWGYLMSLPTESSVNPKMRNKKGVGDFCNNMVWNKQQTSQTIDAVIFSEFNAGVLVVRTKNYPTMERSVSPISYLGQNHSCGSVNKIVPLLPVDPLTPYTRWCTTPQPQPQPQIL